MGHDRRAQNLVLPCVGLTGQSFVSATKGRSRKGLNVVGKVKMNQICFVWYVCMVYIAKSREGWL